MIPSPETTKPATRPDRKPRLVWIDAARGLCVVAVVMLHFRIFVYGFLDPTQALTAEWTEFTDFFGGFRLPLLFAISGLVVSARVRSGWGDRRNVLQAVSTYWIYAVWLCVIGVMSAVSGPRDVPFRIDSVGDFISQVIIPNTILWYIFALVLYVVVLASLRTVHPAIILGSLAGMSVLTGLMPAVSAEALWLHVVYYAFFFAAGVYLKPMLLWVADEHLWQKSVVTVVAFMVFEELWEHTTLGTMLESAARLLRDSSAVAVAIALIALATRLPLFGRATSAIGRQTLPIYILQLPLIWALALIVPDVGPLQTRTMWIWAPLIGTALIVVVSLLLHRLMMRTPLKFMFGLPAPVRKRILNHRSQGGMPRRVLHARRLAPHLARNR